MAVADSDGKVAISVSDESGEVQISFRVASLDGVSFAPGDAVEIPDERLDTALASLLLPFGPGPWRYV